MADWDTMQRAREAWARKLDYAVELAYVTHELLLARLLRVRKMRILFSEVIYSRRAIERWFRFTPHEIRFGEFAPDTLAEYDVLVPLNMADVRRLDGMRHLIAHNRLPIPCSEAIEICDDKLLFARVMQQKGFGDLIPPLLDDRELPYVFKMRHDRGGRLTRVVLSVDDERELPVELGDDCFRQALIPGRFEYATHLLFLKNRPVRWLTFEYDMRQEHQVKGPLRPVRKRMIGCRHLDAFSAVLSAIGFEGLCCIDFKEQQDRPLIMEINPRVGESLCPYFFSYLRDLE